MKSTDDANDPVAEAENPLTSENMDDDNKKSQAYAGKKHVKFGEWTFILTHILLKKISCSGAMCILQHIAPNYRYLGLNEV